MKTTSQLSGKCQKCPHVGTCNEKRKEMCAYIERPDLCMESVSMHAGGYPHADVLVKHDYRDIKIDPNTTVTLDLEEIKKQLKRDFYKANGLCLEFGA